MNYLETNCFLSPSQYGFRSKKSTSDAVHDLTDYIATNLDRGNKVLSIFLDLAKAFDTVSVPILLQKMEGLGIRGTQLKIFQDYLCERTQCVKIDDIISEERSTVYGVPQGSVLAPTLFLIYINDLGMLSLPNGKIITFADDTVLLFSASSWKEVYTIAQSGFDNVCEWLRNNILTLNKDKTKYIAFSLRNDLQLTQLMSTYTIIAHSCSKQTSTCSSCTNIQITDSIKYLGIIIDKNLRFHEHINTLSCRLRKLIYIFKTLRKVADVKLMKSVYLALAQSLITYCITSWGGAAKHTILELERTQRAILKVSLLLPYRYPTDQLYIKSNVLTVRQLFILQSVLKQHALITFNPQTVQDKRLPKPAIQSHITFSTAHIKKFFRFLGPFLYNRINATLPIYHLTKIKCKMKLSNWLQGLNYYNTEALLDIPV